MAVVATCCDIVHGMRSPEALLPRDKLLTTELRLMQPSRQTYTHNINHNDTYQFHCTLTFTWFREAKHKGRGRERERQLEGKREGGKKRREDSEMLRAPSSDTTFTCTVDREYFTLILENFAFCG